MGVPMLVRVAQARFVPLALAAVIALVGLVACKPVRCGAGTSPTGTNCLPDGGLSSAAIGGAGGQAGIDSNASLAVGTASGGTGGAGAFDPAAGADQSGSGIPAGQGSSGYGGADAFGSAGFSGAGTPGAPPADPQQIDPAAPGMGADPCAPSEETCDGQDNDCDTLIDESMVRPCGPTEATGICTPGAETCIAGAWGPCDGAVEPMPMEICDPEKLDENCNGTNNEGCGCIDGEMQPCGKDEGVCKPGTQTCAGGTWSAQCDGAVDPKKPEACDQARQDEDCDGWQNELCLCVDGEKRTCGKNVGICKPGMQTCAGGIWSECAGAVDPGKPEACDQAGQDEDCDGEKNEGCTCTDGAKQPCGKDKGICKPGMQTCAGGSWSTPCVGAVDPGQAEVCDQARLDEDCDGEPNEGCDCIDGTEDACPSMPGVCDPGRHKCEKGTWSGCTGMVMGTAEVCDGQDNDCNGPVDDSVTDCTGNYRCEDGKCNCVPTTTCDTQVCDAVDDCGNPCGRECPTGESEGSCFTGACEQGMCVVADQAQDCALDQDQDGVPADTASATSCLGQCPSDHILVDSSTPRDCDDGDGSRYPGNDTFSADGIDHDCSGNLEPQFATFEDGCMPNDCNCVQMHSDTTASHCGQMTLICGGSDQACMGGCSESLGELILCH